MIKKDILYSAYEADRLDLYTPEKTGFDTVIIFHGGGFENGSRSNLTYMKDLTDAGYGVVSADYRMYPDAKFPDFVEDAAQAVRWPRGSRPASFRGSIAAAGNRGLRAKRRPT